MADTPHDLQNAEDGGTAAFHAAPLLLRAPNAAALCSTSVRTWRMWNAAGKIPRPIRIGRSTYWRPNELNAWVAAGCPDRVTWEIIQKL